ncbi:PREDICTED: protein fosB-like [Tinamus guttatus]|uniref:protein fosB-like n=1 Tax=Tinamus guttatus TaxID=94827 RepID=UPI00052E9B63|nr:PREDICTED: protein fosB-like [Tinamus guttatus]
MPGSFVPTVTAITTSQDLQWLVQPTLISSETDQLEEEKAELESEIAELQKEKERLEFVLVAHAPGCKLPFEDVAELAASASVTVPSAQEVSSMGLPGKEEPFGPAAFLPTVVAFQQSQAPGAPSCPSCCSAPGPPPNPSSTSPFVFTHPEGASCGASHQRSSGSDQSSDSLNSPSLLAL